MRGERRRERKGVGGLRGGGGGGVEPGDGVGREVHDVNTLLQKQVARLKLAVGDSVLEWKSRGEASQQ